MSGTGVKFEGTVDGVALGCEQMREVKNTSGFWFNRKIEGEE